MQIIARFIFVLLTSLTGSCTVVHIIGESGNVETHWMPGFSYIYIEANDRPLYFQNETIGIGLTNNALTLGYGVFEQVVVESNSINSCLLISILDGPTKRDFSFQKRDPAHVCKTKETDQN